MTELSDLTIRDLLNPYGFSPNDQICERIRDYIEVLLRWNRKISLTTVTNPAEIVRFHFGESIFALQLERFENGRLADVGSGAGFPGLAIALAAPQIKINLVEQNAKKSAFLSEVCRSLELSNVVVLHNRIEELPDTREYDFITARAFGHFDHLIRWATEHCEAESKILLWLGEADSREVNTFTEFEWLEARPVPNTKARVILVGIRRK